MLCAGVTAYKALKQLDLIAGKFVGILGAAGGLVTHDILQSIINNI